MLTHNEIMAHYLAIKATVAKRLRTTSYNAPHHVEDAQADIMVMILDYVARTFDPTKGDIRSHLTSFAWKRTGNWLRGMSRRREEYSEDASEATKLAIVPKTSKADTFLAVHTKLALAKLNAKQRELLEAYSEFGNWREAAAYCNMNAPQRQKVCYQIEKILGVTFPTKGFPTKGDAGGDYVE